MNLPKPLAELLSLPTAPFLESAVMDYLERACRRLAGVKLSYDRYGNLLAHYRHQPRRITPLAFVAHTDHPGFAALEMLSRSTLRAAWRGGVRPEFFKDTKVRFWSASRWVKGRVLKLSKMGPPPTPGRPPVPQEAHIRISGPVPPDTLGMWDLPQPALRGDRVVARACDDLAGVAGMLALLQRLSRRRASAEVYCLFTRAEEVGFVGATGAIRAGTIPRRVPVISIETSSALVHAPVGEGPIIRVGDRMVLYSPEFSTFCVRVAQELAKRRRRFKYQRKLMDGGMCEAAAFGSNGYTVLGICLALGNYHNMDTKRKKIASEYVSLSDWKGMVDLFEALVLDDSGPGARDNSLRQRIDGLFENHEPLLK